jgi:hypothetical protein
MTSILAGFRGFLSFRIQKTRKIPAQSAKPTIPEIIAVSTRISLFR